MFELLRQDASSKARHGRLTTAHGVIETPAFMPVGTQGSVKAISPRELREVEAQIILGNTYHLFVRPGMEVMRHFGGLHRFMNWDGPILADSGGWTARRRSSARRSRWRSRRRSEATSRWCSTNARHGHASRITRRAVWR